VGGGGRHKQEGTTEHAPGKERGYGSHRGGAAPSRWRRRGGLMVLGGKEGGWWPAVAPVSFYDTDESRQSLDMSQMKKNKTRGGAHRRGRGGGAPAQFRCGGGDPMAGDGQRCHGRLDKWGGVLRRGISHGPEETTVELSVASMPKQGKRKTRESRFGRAGKGKRGGVRCG
jgi:hypothetical protein